MIVKTFKGRFVLIATTIVSLLVIGAALSIYVNFHRTLLRTIDSSLLAAAKSGVSGETPHPSIIVERLSIIDGQFYSVQSRNGQTTIALVDSAHPWPVNRRMVDAVLRGELRYETAHYMSENVRILYYPVDSDTVIRVKTSLEGIDNAVAELKKLFFLTLPPFFFVTLLLALFFANRVLEPVKKIRSLAEHIRQGQWDHRLSLDAYGREIGGLAELLNEMVATIKRSVESQKRFTADVSHEIRSPLTSLRGNIEVALRKKRDSDEYERILRNNLSDVMRLSRLTDNLLILSRADDKILSLRRHWFDLSRLLETVVESFRDKALQEEVTLYQEYEPDIDLSGDSDLLELAFANVIENAIKYNRRGGSVTIRSRSDDDSVKVIVSDTGVGISEDQIPHIFERFYRADREQSGKRGGSGLGLAIAHRIVKAHRGEISVKSASGKGTEFTITLPKIADIPTV